MDSISYVGLDVHTTTIVVAVADGARSSEVRFGVPATEARRPTLSGWLSFGVENCLPQTWAPIDSQRYPDIVRSRAVGTEKSMTAKLDARGNEVGEFLDATDPMQIIVRRNPIRSREPNLGEDDL
jgi:hypothetical protein